MSIRKTNLKISKAEFLSFSYYYLICINLLVFFTFFSHPQTSFHFFQYGLKKKVPEEENMMMNNDDGGRVGRKKKTPAELAAEANADSDDDEFTSKFSSVCCCLNFF